MAFTEIPTWKSGSGTQAELQKAFKENPIGGLIVWWNNQSKAGKIIWVFFTIAMILGAIINSNKN